jgi:hypothetical protein
MWQLAQKRHPRANKADAPFLPLPRARIAQGQLKIVFPKPSSNQTEKGSSICKRLKRKQIPCQPLPKANDFAAAQIACILSLLGQDEISSNTKK